MDHSAVVTALGALAHDHRLTIYRWLVEQGPAGLPAGEIAERLGVPPSSLTFHLQHLHRAGLIGQRRDGRKLFYTADFERMRDLVGFLTDKCCSADPSACAPVRTVETAAS